MNKIINFHQVDDSIWFDRVISLLKSKYELITIDSLRNYYLKTENMKNICHITVDDGDKSFYEVMFPVLKKHKVPASIYVSPKICTDQLNYWFQEVEGYDQIRLKGIIADFLNMPASALSKYNTDTILKTMQICQIHEIIRSYQKITRTGKKVFQNMTVSNLKEVDQSGLVTIGAHTINHPILSNENDASSKYEISESISELSNILNHDINYFAYPNGIPMLDFTEREMCCLRNYGIQLALTTESNNISASDNRMSIPRFGISSSERIPLFKTKLLLGAIWNTFSRLKPTGEYRNRKNINRLISTGKLPAQNM
jgi:peptidoglycan/xylan/chitin deacetylase (PgdA/CDA1 family)